MKRLLSALLAVLILALSLCSCGETDEKEEEKEPTASEPKSAAAATVLGGTDMCSTEVKENITVTVFRCGEFYYAHFPDKTSKGWSLMNFCVPDEIVLEDGGFGTLTADEKITCGGDEGIAFRLENVSGFEQITANEAAENIGFDEYVPKEDMPYNQIRIFRTDGKEYMIIKIYKSIHVYLDGKPFGEYDTAFEMEAALGLREPIADGDIKIDEQRGITMLVFRCGNAYLSYSTCVALNEWWTPILDADLKNLPTGFSLEDGEIAKINNADILIVNGGDEGYVNAPMLTSPAEAVKKSYFEALPYDLAAWWQGDEDAYEKDGDFWEYTPDDYNTVYFIIFLSGDYYVYRDDGKEQCLKGVFCTAEEVSAAMGISS